MGNNNNSMWGAADNTDSCSNNRDGGLDEMVYADNVFVKFNLHGIINVFRQANKRMGQTLSLKYLVINILGGSAFAWFGASSLLSILGDNVSGVFGQISKPWQMVFIYISIVWAFLILCKMGVSVLAYFTDYKEKSFDLQVKIQTVAKLNLGQQPVLGRDLDFFNEINKAVLDTYSRTKADRFLILKSYNGKYDLKFVGVPYEQHKEHELAYKSIKAAERFKDFEFDDEYRLMIKNSEQMPYVNLIVEDMADCDLRRIYEEEGVTHSQLFFLKRINISADKDEVYFCTFATHYGYFSPLDHSIIKHNFDIIKNKTKQIFT